MTVRINKPAINLREELADLRNQGGYQEQQFYFDNLVTNGTFDTDLTGWTQTGTVFSQSGGGLVVDASLGSGNDLFLDQPFTDEAGKVYAVSFDVVSRVAGRVNVRFRGGTAVTHDPVDAAGSYTFFLVGNGTNSTLSVNVNSAGDMVIDNISVYPADPSDDAPWHKMPKGWLPLHVYEDGLLQREGTSHDYEVIYDGFDYYVKPSVAPGPNTETCVIGVKA